MLLCTVFDGHTEGHRGRLGIHSPVHWAPLFRDYFSFLNDHSHQHQQGIHLHKSPLPSPRQKKVKMTVQKWWNVDMVMSL